jgi:glycosyltransferase involved in cell wall biosynthesis
MIHKNSSVAIILATYNGEKYLAEQLQSFAHQTHSDWHLFVGDDGSSDRTYEMIQEFAKTHPVTWIQNTHLGFAENFMSTLFAAGNTYDYYCFSDQDDVWDVDKLASAITALSALPSSHPALYGSRTRLTDVNGNCYGLSQAFKRPFQFRNAQVQCFAGGNTMMLNRAAWELLHKARKMPIISHDWWCYQLISGAGGNIIFDPEPHLSYRQHGNAAVGTSAGFRPSLARVRRLVQGVWQEWHDVQIAALQANASLLTHENRVVLERFSRARTLTLLPRITTLLTSKVYRQTILGNAGMLVAALTNRM